MKYLENIPSSAESKQKIKKSLARKRAALTTATFACAILSIVLLFGTLGVLLAAEFGKFGSDVKTLLYILTGVFLGGALAFAFIAILFSRVGQNAVERELDFTERCDGENSFFVGEGTLATFGDGKVTLHGGEEGHVVYVPYQEMRFFSVCTRHVPKEKGEWSVVLEIPAHYISKNKAEKNAPPALVQTDAKQRLYDCLAREGLELIGELPAPAQAKKFGFVKKYDRPDRQKRRRAAVLIAAGAVLIAASFPVAFLWEATIGAIMGVLGAFLLGRAVVSYQKAQSTLALYREGMWWKEPSRQDSVFLKWSEIKSCEREERANTPLLKVNCAYGAYHFPSFDGAYEEIARLSEAARAGNTPAAENSEGGKAQ